MEKFKINSGNPSNPGEKIKDTAQFMNRSKEAPLAESMSENLKSRKRWWS